MKQSVIQIKFESDKYHALKRYAVKKEVSVEQELEELHRLYKKRVPVDVREYIEENEEPEKERKAKAKKPEKEEVIHECISGIKQDS